MYSVKVSVNTCDSTVSVLTYCTSNNMYSHWMSKSIFGSGLPFVSGLGERGEQRCSGEAGLYTSLLVTLGKHKGYLCTLTKFWVLFQTTVSLLNVADRGYTVEQTYYTLLQNSQQVAPLLCKSLLGAGLPSVAGPLPLFPLGAQRFSTHFQA